jgi:hypothetical protein
LGIYHTIPVGSHADHGSVADFEPSRGIRGWVAGAYSDGELGEVIAEWGRG